MQKKYFLIILLIVVSGNPILTSQSWSKTMVVVVGFFLLWFLRSDIKSDFMRKYIIYISLFLFIYFVQYVNLSFVSVPFIFGFCIKVFIGGIIFQVLKDQFSKYFFNVIFYICLGSIPFFFVHRLLGNSGLPQFFVLNECRSIGIYTFLEERGVHYIRNSGMFWEPGAFQGFINICLFMNLRRIPYLLKYERLKLVTVIITLLTTQSTTGYITFFVICFIYLLSYVKINKISLTIFMLLFLFIGYYAFVQYGFLEEKLQQQYENTLLKDKNEFSPDRFGAFVFDMHYIKKNPLTGNGFHEKTRYSDHPYLQNQKLGHGNGFSNFLACAGILGMFWYLYMIIRFQRKPDSLFLCLIVVVLLQGEQFLNYSFWLGLPFYRSYLYKS
ncbi:hypothetical protein FACS1894182_06430 [Bacteroidia bacterium]|nr:hypothetical protein FACS1894182_06430 [Bacteroidia bacterium]